MPYRRGFITVIVVFLVLAPLGQALGMAAMSCSMVDMPAAMHEMSAASMDAPQDEMPCGDHAHHPTPASSEADECQMDGSCLMSSCISTVALPNSSQSPEWRSSPNEVELGSPSLTQAAITSPYRPPISR